MFYYALAEYHFNTIIVMVRVMPLRKKIVLVIAHERFHPVEYAVPKKILEEAQYTIITASDRAVTATAADRSVVHVDITLDALQPKHYDGIFLIGGPGTLDCLNNPTTYAIVQNAAQALKPLGAICMATQILMYAGVLKNKRATGWNGDGQVEELYRQHGIQYVDDDVVSDGLLLTASGPQVAQQFAHSIMDLVPQYPR